MKKLFARSLIAVALIVIFATVWLCVHYCISIDKIFQILLIVVGSQFFVYKLLTGWLISNLNVKIEPQRLYFDNQRDHLGIKLTLTKGSIDSVWIEKILIRVSQFTADSPTKIEYFGDIEPINYHKRDVGVNFWQGSQIGLYTLSIGEETSFSGYLTVTSGYIVLVETLVLGTRLFYGIESFNKTKKYIQWRSSAVVLPAKAIEK